MKMVSLIISLILPTLFCSFAQAEQKPFATIKPADSVPGYIARIMINEIPFPGEHGYVSEQDSKNAMLSILWVLHSRIENIPSGYKQKQIAATRTEDIIDIITVGGKRGQCDGFYRNQKGEFVTVARVEKRLANLLNIANSGSEPGRFANLLNYVQTLATLYVDKGIKETDRYAKLNRIGKVPVTGRAYSWMTDMDCYHPGGNFVSIPDQDNGSLGGNRFFTLRKIE